jgi:hypothetical protein
MSNNRNRYKGKAQTAVMTRVSADRIPENTAMMHIISTNMLSIAFADIADAEARIAKARRQIISEQPTVTVSMRRLVDRTEAYVLSAIKTVNRNAKKVH